MRDVTPARLRIGLIAPPWVPVPPPVYGGTELVVDLLARGLRDAGCEVELFATGDSTCPVTRSSCYPGALGTTAPGAAEVLHVRAAYERLAGMDVIHDHTLCGPLLRELHPHGVPVVTTVHGELVHPLPTMYGSAAGAGVTIVAISHAQAAVAPEVPVETVIHHGVDPALCELGAGDGGYVLFLGRMSPDKGAHRAIDVARAAGRRILLAAKMWEPDELRYFADQVQPRLGPDAVYLGQVTLERKVELLAGAEALLNPIRWREPFGLVMIEALACGTPVLTFPEGAAPEIVEDGRSGFLCRDEADMAAKLARVHEIDRAACRDRVLAAFTAERMVADHLALYGRLQERAMTSSPYRAKASR